MKELNFKTIGAKIKERRRQKRLTQEYVGNCLDVNASHISNIEAGRTHPSLTALVCIANVLECSVDLFLDEEYEFTNNEVKSEPNLNDAILEKIRYFDKEKKQRVLKILDLL